MLGRDAPGRAAVRFAPDRTDPGGGDGAVALVDHDRLRAGLAIVLVAVGPAAARLDVALGEVAEVAQLIAVLLGFPVNGKPRGELGRADPVLGVAVPGDQGNGRRLRLESCQNNIPSIQQIMDKPGL